MKLRLLFNAAMCAGQLMMGPSQEQEAHMNRITSIVFAGIAGLILVSTVAEAADGCGRGMYYNGRRCVPQDDDGYGRRDYGPPVGGPTLRLDLGGGRDEARCSPIYIAIRFFLAGGLGT